jgi:hypothetical protein
MSDSIHARAMLVSLSISAWNARKFDRKATEKVSREHGVTSDAGRYTKHLLGGASRSATHNAVLAAASAARSAHYEQTLPWSDEGWRLLPSANFMAYNEEIRKARARFDQAVADFLAEYPSLRLEAHARLNGLYRPEDYPSEQQMRARFGIEVEFSPVPDAGDFRLDLPADRLSEIEATVTSRVQRATGEAMRDAWGRLYDYVDRYHDRLNSPHNLTRYKLVGGLNELVDLLKRLNVAGDPQLESMRARVEQELAVHGAKDLHDDDDLRASTARRAGEILDTMRDFYGGPS